MIPCMLITMSQFFHLNIYLLVYENEMLKGIHVSWTPVSDQIKV